MILERSPKAGRASKQASFHGIDEPTLEQAMRTIYPAHQENITSQDYIEGSKAFAERRKPNWRNQWPSEEIIDDAGDKPDHRVITPGECRQMKARRDFGFDSLGPAELGQALWMGLILASGISLSAAFACVTPFVALATLSALKLHRRHAFAVIGMVWLANQAVGYGLLGYPWTWNSLAWGLAIGASAGLAVLAATALSTTRPAPLAVSLPFVAGFAAFEFGLYGAGFILPGGDGAFTASAVGHVFLINAVMLCGLVAAYNVVAMAALPISRRASTARPLGAPL
jgi:hypothetical protein